jgi:hypothetical protein
MRPKGPEEEEVFGGAPEAAHEPAGERRHSAARAFAAYGRPSHGEVGEGRADGGGAAGGGD